MKTFEISARRRTAIELGCALGLVLTLALTLMAGQAYRTACAAVCRDTLRLHILANSDTVEDQLLKFKVRDAVLAAMPDLLPATENKAQAVAAVQKALPALQMTAQGALRTAHSDLPVQLRLETYDFPPKDYGDFALPGGAYTALRIELGAAAGHNWFCVLYPGLCVSASAPRYETPAENAIVFGKYEVRFALVDLVKGLRDVV